MTQLYIPTAVPPPVPAAPPPIPPPPQPPVYPSPELPVLFPEPGGSTIVVPPPPSLAATPPDPSLFVTVGALAAGQANYENPERSDVSIVPPLMQEAPKGRMPLPVGLLLVAGVILYLVTR